MSEFDANPASQRGTLSLIGTPIGNRGDLSPRARDAILQAQLLFCEDTRSPQRLFGEGVSLPPRKSCFAANEEARCAELLSVLASGQSVAFISEAGMPSLSDPGQRLAEAAWSGGFTVDVIPGPCAAIVALAASGFAAQGAVFWGFAPRKGSGRKTLLETIRDSRTTFLLYEAGNRVPALLEELEEVMATTGAERRVLVARELTKGLEEKRRGTLRELRTIPEHPDSWRGEFTIVVEGNLNKNEEVAAPSDARSLWAALSDPELKPRERARKIAELIGEDTREVYETLLRLRGSTK